MNIRKKGYGRQHFSPLPRSKSAMLVLQLGFLPIFVIALSQLFLLAEKESLTPAGAAYFSGMLEYTLGALIVVIAGAFLLDVAEKNNKK